MKCGEFGGLTTSITPLVGKSLLMITVMSVVGRAAAFHHFRRVMLPSSSSSSSSTLLYVPSPPSSSLFDDLLRHPAAENWADSSKTTAINGYRSQARKRLKNLHLPFFNSSSLFDQFARVVLPLGMIARKELFETWASALLIHGHAQFATQRRIADVASGHGLLSWALLVMDDNESSSLQRRSPRTALCVDQRMPLSAELLFDAMTSKWPQLSGRFSFVEGGISDVVPHPSCLFVSVHACGSLSDALVRLAIEANAPLALVPCCHSRRKLTDYSPWAVDEYERILVTAGDSDVIVDLVDALDGARQTALRRAGYHVDLKFLPQQFTAKNKMMLAVPTRTSAARVGGGWTPPAQVDGNGWAAVSQSTAGDVAIRIPCADTEEARKGVDAMAGKHNAEKRKRDKPGNASASICCPPARCKTTKQAHASLFFDLSLWLPGGEAAGEVTAEALSKLASSVDDDIFTECDLIDEWTDVDSPLRRTARTFRMRYRFAATVPVAKVLSRDRAKDVHAMLYHAIPVCFPGAECRLSKKGLT